MVQVWPRYTPESGPDETLVVHRVMVFPLIFREEMVYKQRVEMVYKLYTPSLLSQQENYECVGKIWGC